MEKSEILTAWAGDGSEENPNHPSIQDDHAITKWSDVTGQPSENLTPNPNLYVIYVEAESNVLDAIEADPNYEIIWREEIPVEEV